MSRFAGLLLGSVVFAGLTAVGAILWMTGPARTEPSTTAAVYVCQKSGEIFVGRGQSAPLLHPDTGKPTLYPGLYCSRCRAWKPAPPMDRLYRQPELLDCPSCRIRRSFAGTIPEHARKL